MSAIMIAPTPFTVVSANEATLSPARHMNLDDAGLVWRSSSLTSISFVVDRGANARPYDAIVLIGSNLRSTDTVQVTTGTTSTGIGSYASAAVPAFVGFKPDETTTKTLIRFPAQTARYVRVVISASAHPIGYVEVMRLVIGEVIEWDGINRNPEMSIIDPSPSIEGAGWESFDPVNTRIQWKFNVNYLDGVVWRQKLFPLLQRVGNRSPIFFDPHGLHEYFQTDSVFGRITSSATGKLADVDAVALELTILSINR